jgi:hypothetical protein
VAAAAAAVVVVVMVVVVVVIVVVSINAHHSLTSGTLTTSFSGTVHADVFLDPSAHAPACASPMVC